MFKRTKHYQINLNNVVYFLITKDVVSFKEGEQFMQGLRCIVEAHFINDASLRIANFSTEEEANTWLEDFIKNP